MGECPNLKLLAFDLDGVLVDITNSWEYMHRYFNSDQSRVKSRYSRLYAEGRINYIEWVREDIRELLRNASRKIYMGDLYEAFSRVRVNSRLIDYLRSVRGLGFKIAIVSGGIYILAERVGRMIGADYIYANKLLFNDRGELIPDGIVMVEPLAKDSVLREIASRENIDRDNILFVGDSEWDLPALLYAGYSIVFKCEKCFNDLINTGKDPSQIFFAENTYDLIKIMENLISCDSI